MRLSRTGGLLVVLAAITMLYQVSFAFWTWDVAFPGIGEFLFGSFWRWKIAGLDHALICVPYVRLLLLLLIPVAIKGLLGKAIARPGKLLLIVMFCGLFCSHLLQSVEAGGLLIYSGPDGFLFLALHLLLAFGCLCLLVGRIAEPPSREERGFVPRAHWLLFGFRGRITRKSCWGYLVLLPLLLCGAALLLVSVSPYCYGFADAFDHLGIIQLHVAVLMFWPGLALYTKRCHDHNRSGWFQLLGYIPLVNIYFLILIFCLRGSSGENRFGLDPLQPADAQRPLPSVASDSEPNAQEQELNRLRSACAPLWNSGHGSLLLYRLGGLALILGLVLQVCSVARLMFFYRGSQWPQILLNAFFGAYVNSSFRSAVYVLTALPATGILWLLVLPLAIRALLAKRTWGFALLCQLVLLAAIYLGHMLGLLKWGDFLLDADPRFLLQLVLPEALFWVQAIGLVLILANFSAVKKIDAPLGFGDRLRWLLVSLKGRATRRHYWLGMILLGLLMFALSLSSLWVLERRYDIGAFVVVVLVAHLLVLICWFQLALQTKRCHDRGKSGWYQLLCLIPLVNIYVAVEMLFFKGTDGINRFGDDPQIQAVCEEFLFNQETVNKVEE